MVDNVFERLYTPYGLRTLDPAGPEFQPFYGGALREGCAGQLPEIYDGGDPVTSKGCFAQAWSVGELLRVYDALEGRLPEPLAAL